MYEWKITAKKMLKAIVLFGVPLVYGTIYNLNPELLSITVGTILLGVENAVKHWND